MGPIGFCFHKYHHIYGKNVTVFLHHHLLRLLSTQLITRTAGATKLPTQKLYYFLQGGLGVSWIQTNIRSKYVCLIIFIHSVIMLYTYVSVTTKGGGGQIMTFKQIGKQNGSTKEGMQWIDLLGRQEKNLWLNCVLNGELLMHVTERKTADMYIERNPADSIMTLLQQFL